MPKDEAQSISPAQFFSMNRAIAGFTNPAKSLYTTIRELIENSLDACEAINVFPNICIRVRRLTPEELRELGIIDILAAKTQKAGERINNVREEASSQSKEEEDEEESAVPEVFEIIVSDNGKGIPSDKIPILLGKVLTSTKYKIKQQRGRFGLGLKMAIIYSLQELNTPVEVWSATRSEKFLSYYKLKIDIVNNEPIILEKKEINKSEFKDPWNRKMQHGTVIKLLIVGDWTRAKPYVLEYLKQLAIITPYATFLFEGPNDEKIYYERVSNKMPPPAKESKYHLSGIDAQTLIQLMREHKRLSILEFLTITFERVGEKTAREFLKALKVRPETPVKNILRNDKLITSFVRLASVYKFKRPDPSALSPIGEELLKQGLTAILKPAFTATYQRKPISLQGHPLIVEAAVAYGGEIQPGIKLLRFANRVPLLHKTKSDVGWKALEEIDLSRYKVTEQDPIVLAVSVVSTKIPFPTTSKDYIDDVDILRREIKLAFMRVLRKLRIYLTHLERLKQLEEKRKALMRYTKKFATSISKILKTDPKYKDCIEARDDAIYAYLVDIIDHRISTKTETSRSVHQAQQNPGETESKNL
ncbi:MAG: DNA topoisomerase VI subunit B [Crenarchaeota archaeon]|nr:DNA topoisomerase VI subunit B [Thermoproteota archaeon]